ncbi:Hsp20 alpha crystallin family [Brachionus plicatilis]|uniref:Hsp20 alpha crystallin family n=1 Tax=Brachionus plicatilis TaxID=10195 RepID=A0A3M7QCD3_BRAPC|nr:Hsp20 alpha crystallin family [Brachionus plicatilis]
MSLLKTQHFPRSMFETHWPEEGQRTDPLMLDMFDPYDELDRSIARNLHWIDRPKFLMDVTEPPRVPHKFRFSLDCLGFDPKTIKTVIKEKKLIVTGGNGRIDLGDGDFIHKEFRRTYDLPENAETDKLASFVTSVGNLVIEVPLRTEQKKNAKGKYELVPKVIEDNKGNKIVQLNIALAQGIEPSNIRVTCKDNDLIVRGEKIKHSKDEYSKFHVYKRCRLPENTDFEHLKCILEKDELSIAAPIKKEHITEKRNGIQISSILSGFTAIES